MSKICILALSSSKIDHVNLKQESRQQFYKIGCGVFFDFKSYHEPIIEKCRDSSLICSISDDQRFDNCEMLILPDNCSFGGLINEVSFYDRMELLGGAIGRLIPLSCKTELFVGDSGTLYEDFDEIHTTIQDFPRTIDKLFNNTYFPALHFVFI